MDLDVVLGLFLLVLGVCLSLYLVLWVVTDGVAQECLRQNATWSNVTRVWEGCVINAVA